jgi:diguanylate cyclase (GGDEF)-like protein/PAS domain S-box-containing protein
MSAGAAGPKDAPPQATDGAVAAQAPPMPAPSGTPAEIAALIETLLATEARLALLTGGEVDTVTNQAGHLLMMRRAQEHLRHTEVNRHATVLNALPAHIALLDAQGGILSVNDAWRRYAAANGMRSANCGVGLNYLEVCDASFGPPPLEAQRVADGIRSVLAGDAAEFSLEYPCHAPGQERWFLATVTPLTSDLAGSAVVMHMDITQRKQGEAQRHALQSLLDNIVDNIPTAVHLKSIADGFRIGLWNKAAEAMYGLPRAQALGRSGHDLWPPADADRMLASDHTLVAGSAMQDFADRLVPTLDRGPIHVHMRKVLLRDDGGVATHVLVIADDITQWLEKQARLRESERRFSDLLENVDLVAVMLDCKGRITYCNPCLLRLTGWEQSEVLGQDWFTLFMPAELGDTQPIFAALLADSPQAWHVEQAIYTRTRERRLVRWNNSVLRSATGEVIGTASMGVDITAQTHAALRIQRLNQAYAMLSGINSLQVRVQDRTELLCEACRIAVDEGRFSMAWVGLLDAGTGGMAMCAEAGVGPVLAGLIRATMAILPGAPPGYAATLRTLESGKAVVFNDLREGAEFDFGARHFPAGTQSMVVLPLMVQDRLAGIITLCASEANYFLGEELAILRELAGDIAFAIDHIAKRERLDYLAYYDVLTGLANRSLFLERLAQFLRSAADSGGRLALYMIDVERFKNINDSMGTPAGDAVLRLIAEWLQASVEEAAFLARVGADRFAIVQTLVDTEEDLERTIRIRSQAFADHVFKVGDAVVRIAFKTGIAVSPKDGVDADTLFKHAEAALKQAKALGERHLFYHRKMTVRMAGRVSLESRLRQALDNGEFVLYYQPKVQLRGGQLTGAEALIRWKDPGSGLVAPGLFVPVLEETGLIYEVGRWALRQAVEDRRRWHAAGLDAVPIAVNVSPLQLRNRGFIGEIEQAIGTDPDTAAGLELEITESVIMDDVHHSIDSLTRIRALGLRIAIDDFGTGFSSLSYLARLPVDSLKIDRSFVMAMTSSPQGLALVSTIIGLGHAMNIKVVAEGVEQEEQQRLLHLLGCDEMQGYLLSRPVTVGVFETEFLVPSARAQPGTVTQDAS